MQDLLFAGVFDTHWGDSGKGKVIHFLITGPWKGRVGVNVRWNGGPNAGHTVVQGGKKAILHMLPSSILAPDVNSLIAPMCVINIKKLVHEEMAQLAELGVTFERLKIAAEAFTILPWHLLIEQTEERLLGGNFRDTTLRGIGPAYRDIVGRYGIAIGDLLENTLLMPKVAANLAVKGKIPGLNDGQLLGIDATAEQLLKLGQSIRPWVVETDGYLGQWAGTGKIVLLEGAQGTGLDVMSPSYPFVTSSGLTVHDAEKIFRIDPGQWGSRIGVSKAYTTSVGRRDFPTKLTDATGEYLRKAGSEYGATTGQARDCGWLDGVMLRHAVVMNRITHIFVTKLDVLDELPTIRVAVAYRRNGEELPLPPRLSLADCQPVYQNFDGWQSSTRGIRALADLPANARRYIDFIEQVAGRPVIGISTGPDTDDTIWLE